MQKASFFLFILIAHATFPMQNESNEQRPIVGKIVWVKQQHNYRFTELFYEKFCALFGTLLGCRKCSKDPFKVCKVLGALIALKKKLPAYGLPNELIDQIGYDIISDRSAYTNMERINIGMELAATTPFDNTRTGIINYLFDNFPNISLMNFAQKYGYTCLWDSLATYKARICCDKKYWQAICNQHKVPFDSKLRLLDLEQEMIPISTILTQLSEESNWINNDLAQLSFNIIQSLIDSDIDPNIQAQNGQTLLHLVIYESFHKGKSEGRRKPLVKKLLCSGANPNIVCRKSFAPLHLSLLSCPDEVEELLDHNADVNLLEHDRTPLHLSVGRQLWHESSLLLDHGSDPTRVNSKGESPLSMLRSRNPVVGSAADALLQRMVAIEAKKTQ